jgi:hypothetical protein
MVDTLQGGALSFLGVELRRVGRRPGPGHCIVMTPKTSARLAIKAKMREISQQAGATPRKAVIVRITRVVAGWAHYFRCGHASRACRDVRDDVEVKVRTLRSRRKRRHKRGIGWRRWRSVYLYEVLGLCWDWTVRYLPHAGSSKCKWQPEAIGPLTRMVQLIGCAA